MLAHHSNRSYLEQFQFRRGEKGFDHRIILQPVEDRFRKKEQGRYLGGTQRTVDQRSIQRG